MATPVPQKDDVERWTVEQVAAWLQQVELSDCCDTFLRRGIDGHGFLQLSQEDLFQWGRDVSIRNRLQILKLVKQIKNLQQHPCTTRQSIEISLDLGSQPLKPYNDNAVDSDVKGFSCCEEETEEYAGQEASPTPPIPMRSADMATCSSFPRTNTGQNNILHGPGSRSLETHSDNNLNDCEDSSFDEEEIEEHSGQRMQPGKENAQGEECIDDLYLVPLRASPTTNHSSILNRELPTNLQRSGRLPSPSNSSSIIHQHGGMSWNQHPVKKGTPNNGRSHAPTIPERIPRRSPAPPPDTLAASHNKQPSPLHFQALTTNAAIHAPLQGANIIHGLAENGSSGVKGGLSLQRHQFPSSTLSTWQTDNESIQAHLPTQSLEKNDHVYEIVDIPQGFYGGTEAPGPNMSDQQSPIRPPIPPPRNQNQDSDDRDLSSRQGPVSLAHSKRHAPPLPPPLVRSQLEGHNSSQARPPAPDLPIRTDRIRQPKAPPSFSGNSSHSSHKTFPQESHAPQQFSPMPTEGNLPSISLGNGECIELTPLYQMIMDKPYFQFVSRPKAKELVLQGGEGTFLIRPSTRTDKPLTLTVKHDDRSYNINIRQRPDTLFALGNEKASERVCT